MSNTELSTLEREVAPVLQRANTITVRSADDRTDAMEFLRAVKSANKRASEFFGPIVDAAHKAWKQTTVSRASILDPLEAAEKRVKATVGGYDQEQERVRQEEQRRLQAIADEAARKERQKAEQEAEKQRDIQRIAEAKAAESRRLAGEASAADRKRLLAQAEAAERKAAAASAKVEERQEQAAAVLVPVVQIAEPEKQKGESTRQRWKMELTNKAALIAAAASGNDLAASLLTYDESAGNRIAPTIKNITTIPGVAIYAVSELAVKI